MQFDIIELTQDELIALSTVQMRLLRSAQREKDELTAELARDKQTFYNITVTNGMLGSGVYEDKCGELEAECERRVDIIRDDLIYNMSLNVPTGGDGDDPPSGGEAGYIVDYSLSYLDRYQIVRSYYMAIADPAERLAVYTADETAKAYLGMYYTTLYNVLYQYI